MIGRNPAPSLFFIEDFAHAYIQPFDHSGAVKEEHLADAFRAYAGLPPFPSRFEIVDVLERARVDLKAFTRPVKSLPGANTWASDGRPAIYLNPELSGSYAETTICHELREVLENAFKRVKPSYAGLETHDNRVMNPRSDRFAANLLMPRGPTQSLLWNLGFDVVAFAFATGRSIPSVMLRAQEVYPAKSGAGITAGLWLFQQPWSDPPPSTVSIGTSRVGHRAHLRGFSTNKQGGASASLARRVFPRPGARLEEFEVPRLAFQRRRPVIKRVGGFDLFGERDYLVIAEPLLDQKNVPWRVFNAAVRADCLQRVRPWLARLAVNAEQGSYQTA